jgi:hypothetical protein
VDIASVLSIHPVTRNTQWEEVAHPHGGNINQKVTFLKQQRWCSGVLLSCRIVITQL